MDTGAQIEGSSVGGVLRYAIKVDRQVAKCLVGSVAFNFIE